MSSNGETADQGDTARWRTLHPEWGVLSGGRTRTPQAQSKEWLESDRYLHEALKALYGEHLARRERTHHTPEEHKVSSRAGSDDMSDVSRVELDAKLSATEARIEAAVQRLVTIVETRTAKIDHMPSTWTLICTVGGGVVASAALMLGIIALSADRFDSGTQLGGNMTETRVLTQQNAQQIRQITDQISAQQKSIDLLVRAELDRKPNPR